MGTSTHYSNQPATSNIYEQPKGIASGRSSKHGKVNQGTASSTVARTRTDENQMGVSLGHNNATVGFQKRQSRLLTIKEQFMKKIVTVVTFAHINWNDYPVFKRNGR